MFTQEFMDKVKNLKETVEENELLVQALDLTEKEYTKLLVQIFFENPSEPCFLKVNRARNVAFSYIQLRYLAKGALRTSTTVTNEQAYKLIEACDEKRLHYREFIELYEEVFPHVTYIPKKFNFVANSLTLNEFLLRDFERLQHLYDGGYLDLNSCDLVPQRRYDDAE